MILYELTHEFYCYAGELVYSPKKLGLYQTSENVKEAIQYYCTQPGFCENQYAFSAKEKMVHGKIADDTVFEVLIYLHSEDYEFELEIELGLFGDEYTAQSKLNQYCRENSLFLSKNNLIIEEILNRHIVNRREWPEGFSISDLF